VADDADASSIADGLAQLSDLIGEMRRLVANITQASDQLSRQPTKLLFGDRRKGYEQMRLPSADADQESRRDHGSSFGSYPLAPVAEQRLVGWGLAVGGLGEIAPAAAFARSVGQLRQPRP